MLTVTGSQRRSSRPTDRADAMTSISEDSVGAAMGRRPTLAAQVADALRAQLAAGERPPGSRLQSETDLAAAFGVSRPTVRAALRELETLGLVRIQHGVGSFVVDRPTVRAGLEQLGSMTESIRATGRRPAMQYASRLVRPSLPEEAARMDLPAGIEVLELRRTILADEEIVAYSYDLLPTAILPTNLDVQDIDGSIYAFLRERCGRNPSQGIADVHAVASKHVGWGREAAAHGLYVLLNQLHYDVDDELLLYSRTYYIEGRYAFTIIRCS